MVILGSPGTEEFLHEVLGSLVATSILHLVIT